MPRESKKVPLAEREMLAIAKKYLDDCERNYNLTWERMQDKLCSLPKDEADRLIHTIKRERWARIHERRRHTCP